LGPVLEKLATKANGSWILAKVDTDKNQEIAAKYGIRGIPNCKLFHKGEVINEFTGALSEQLVKQWLNKSLPGKFADQIEKAKQLINDGKQSEAKTLLESVIKSDENNSEVKVFLAKLILFENPEEALKLVKHVDGTLEYIELAESIQTLAGIVSKFENANGFPDGDVKDEYLSAIQELKNNNFDESLEKFINVIRTERQYDNDGSRKTCIAIFKYLGEEDEITLKHRKDFGSALYI